MRKRERQREGAKEGRKEEGMREGGKEGDRGERACLGAAFITVLETTGRSAAVSRSYL